MQPGNVDLKTHDPELFDMIGEHWLSLGRKANA